MTHATPAHDFFKPLTLALLAVAACAAEAPTDEPIVDDPTAGEETPQLPPAPGDGSNRLGAPKWKVLDVDHQIQQTGYWCGPAATRTTLSARFAPPSQQALANQLGTTSNGTDWVGQVTNVLNRNLGHERYATVELPDDPPTPAQRERLWRDIVLAVDADHPIVANIVAPASNHPPGYPNYTIYHYVALTGYNPETKQVHVHDSANFGGNTAYWLSFDQIATLIPPKGYTAYRCGHGLTVGAIDAHYRAFGGCGGMLGPALTEERTTPDGVGRYNVFQQGSIYWTPATGAHEVHGAIRDKWAELGWEAGFGYPTSDEYDVPEGKRSDFEQGSITWNKTTFAVTATRL